MNVAPFSVENSFLRAIESFQNKFSEPLIKYFIRIFILISFLPVWAETTNRMLDEVQVEGEKNAVGEKPFSQGTEWKVPEAVKTQMETSSLSDLLTRTTPIFMKESGNGMLATISMRGTSASHTNVNWEGVNINSKTMGQVDFNQMPLFFFDKVGVYPGGESAVFGNGSIGGAVNLQSDRTFRDTFRLQLHSTFGSNNSLFEGLKMVVGEEHVHSHTAFFYRRSDNDFKFDYRGETQRQKNASFYDYGILEDLSIRLKKKSVLSGHLWHTFYDREIQPMMQQNNDSTKYESISNRSSRVVVEYANLSPYTWKIRGGWMEDDQVYEEDTIATDTWLAQATVEHDWFPSDYLKIRAKAGYEFQAIIPHVYAYFTNETEYRHTAYVLTKFDLLSRWLLTLNLRKEYVSHTDVPFAPSAGLSYFLLKKSKQQLSLSVNYSKNVNVPSLNDKYWGLMGNRDLQTENGNNIEAGLKYGLSVRKYALKFQGSLYRNNVKNWILWIPRGNVWKPLNIARVKAKGIELSVEQGFKGENKEINLLVNYAFNHTEVMEGFAEMKPFVGQQVALIPEQTFSATLWGSIQHFNCSILGKYVGERHSSDIFDILDSYFVMNVMADYEIHFKNRRRKNPLVLDLGAQVNNILGMEYQVMSFRAMPKQNFVIFAKFLVSK